jgi:integrase
MEQEAPRITPLRRRMIDDMRMRKLQEKTQTQYIRAVRRLAAFLGRSPDTATAEDLRRFQLYLVESGCSPITLNATITGLKFFFDVTVGRFEVMAKMQSVHVPQKIPVVLSREEVARLLAAVHTVKHHTALSVAYGAGLRASEVISLKVSDVDGQRMTLRVGQRRAAALFANRIVFHRDHSASTPGRASIARVALSVPRTAVDPLAGLHASPRHRSAHHTPALHVEPPARTSTAESP